MQLKSNAHGETIIVYFCLYSVGVIYIVVIQYTKKYEKIKHAVSKLLSSCKVAMYMVACF